MRRQGRIRMNRTILLAGGADYISLHTYLALLRVIELAGCRRLVLFSLASVYGIPDGVPTSETAPCPPTAEPRSRAKKCWKVRYAPNRREIGRGRLVQIMRASHRRAISTAVRPPTYNHYPQNGCPSTSCRSCSAVRLFPRHRTLFACCK